MPDTEIPEDVRELARKVVSEATAPQTHATLLSSFDFIAARAIMADRASRAPDPSRDGLVEALRVYEEALGDLDSVENKIMLAHRNGADVTEFEDDLAEATAACIKAFRRRGASK